MERLSYKGAWVPVAYVNVHVLKRFKEELGWAINKRFRLIVNKTLQKLKYDIHTKLPLESYQIQSWYDCSGNLV